MDNPTKSHCQGAYLSQPLYYGASGGYSFIPSYLSSFSSPHCLTCPLLPPWLPAPPALLFYKVVLCIDVRHRTEIDPGAARPPPPPGSTLAVSLPENRISEDDGSDDAPRRSLKFYATFYLSRSLLYSGITYTPSFSCY